MTGPYAFAAGVLTFLVSKEFWILEHEFYSGLALLGVLTGMVKGLGPTVSEYLNKLVSWPLYAIP